MLRATFPSPPSYENTGPGMLIYILLAQNSIYPNGKHIFPNLLINSQRLSCEEWNI